MITIPQGMKELDIDTCFINAMAIDDKLVTGLE